MKLNWTKKIKNVLALLSLGLFVNCEAQTLEEMANKYSFFNGVEVIKSSDVSSNSKIIWIDVRPKQERGVAIILGSLSEEEFLQKLDKGELKNQKFVAYCTIGHRSGKFAQKMKKKGVDVANLYGGILAWVDKGGVVVNPEGEAVREIHVYGPDWNILPKGYKGVW